MKEQAQTIPFNEILNGNSKIKLAKEGNTGVRRTRIREDMYTLIDGGGIKSGKNASEKFINPGMIEYAFSSTENGKETDSRAKVTFNVAELTEREINEAGELAKEFKINIVALTRIRKILEEDLAQLQEELKGVVSNGEEDEVIKGLGIFISGLKSKMEKELPSQLHQISKELASLGAVSIDIYSGGAEGKYKIADEDGEGGDF